MRSDHRPADTSPLINGGSYVNKFTGEEGVINGVTIEATSGNKMGRLYTYRGGSNPINVIENTESFSHWELVSAPTKKAAEVLNGLHAKARAERAEKLKATARIS